MNAGKRIELLKKFAGLVDDYRKAYKDFLLGESEGSINARERHSELMDFFLESIKEAEKNEHI